MIGRTLLHYQVLEKVGAGGMGDVYLAEDKKLKRKVALKILPSEMASDPDRLARFQREAEAIAALNHPNIVTIHSVDEAEGLHFLTMELVEGESLDQRIPDGGMSLADFLDVALPLTDGLAAAHEKGITHRDLKPPNVMVSHDGRPKILDFGLAKFESAPTAESEGSEAPTEAQTQEGRVLGTVPYMSPEQVEGKSVDHRSDIFSLGILLYEMAAGRRPFEGDSMAAVMSSILRDAPRSLSAIPPALAKLIGRCLEKAPRDRIQSAREIHDELVTLRSETTAVAEKPPPSIAVLPFANMSADPDNDYFGDGLAEEIINALAKLESLRVVARTSAFSFKGKDADIPEIGKKLAVETVLEGSVRQAGNRLRITAQLVNVADGYHLWSERYDRELEDVFAIQDEITAAIVDKLKVKLLGAEKEELLNRATTNKEAFALYLKGRYHFHSLTTPELQKAVRYFREAIDLDPDYAKAYAGVAGAIMFMGGAGPIDFLTPGEAHPQARTAIEKALELDSQLPEAQAMLGVMRTTYELDGAGAERAFQQALSLSPNNADTRFWYAWHLWLRGRLDDALSQFEKVLELDPLSLLFQSVAAMVVYCSRRYQEAIERFQQVLDMHPNWFHAQMHLGDAYCAIGEFERAEATYVKARAHDAEHSYYLHARLCAVHAALGRREEAMKAVDELVAISRERYVPPAFVALAYLGVEDYDEVFRWLDKESTVKLAVWAIFPWADPVRSDPRFQTVLERLALPS